MVRGLLYSGHRIPILVFVAQSENTSMIISLGRGQEVSSTPRGYGKPHGSSVLLLGSGLCNMTCPGVVLPSLDGILVYHRLPPVFCQVALSIGQYHFHSLEV